MTETCTVTLTFGTADRWASSSVACASLADAVREAAKCIEGDYYSPLLSVVIESGDHAPRSVDGVWTAAPDGGWSAC